MPGTETMLSAMAAWREMQPYDISHHQIKAGRSRDILDTYARETIDKLRMFKVNLEVFHT